MGIAVLLFHPVHALCAPATLDYTQDHMPKTHIHTHTHGHQQCKTNVMVLLKIGAFFTPNDIGTLHNQLSNDCKSDSGVNFPFYIVMKMVCARVCAENSFLF